MKPASAHVSASTIAPTRWLLALSVLYIVVYLPALGELAIYHGDERFYTDGALVMLRTGEWTTAVTAAGAPRFNKPLLGYWLVAATFGALGIGPTASRLPSLFAGLMTAWLIWAVARRSDPDEDVAVLAGALVLANVGLGVLARRATPDMLMAAFTTLSLAGYWLLAAGLGGGGAAAAAWIGAGLGVATKGIPAVAAACFGLAAWGLGGADRAPLRAVLRPVPIAMGGLIALAGTALPFLRHGPAALAGLYDDQVTVRGVASSFGDAVEHWRMYAGMTVVDFLPWSLLAVVAVAVAPSAVMASLRQGRRLTGYALAWWVALSIGLAGVGFVRPRYMAPAYPLLAVPLAIVLVAAARQPAGARTFRAILRIAGLVVAGLGLLLAGAGAFLDPRLAFAGVALMAGGILAARTRTAPEGGGNARESLLGLVALALLLFGTAERCIRPVFAPAAEPSTAQRLLALGPDGEQAIGIGLTLEQAAKLRLASAARVPLPELDVTALADPPAGRILVVRARAAAELARRGWAVERAGVAYDRVGPSDALEALIARDRATPIAARRHDLFIAVPPARP